MANYKSKIQADNKHLHNLTSARFEHLDGSANKQVVAAVSGCRLLRVILNTKGAAITLRSGSRVIGVISATASEGSFNYGVYCPDGLICEASGTVDYTVVYDL